MHVLLLSSGCLLDRQYRLTSVRAVYPRQKNISAVAHACRLIVEYLNGAGITSTEYESDLEAPDGQIILHRWTISNDFIVEITSCKVIAD